MPGVENRTARRATTVIACPACGYEAADDFAFCPRCATSLAAPRTTAEELKVVTTLFCDLVGFTAMSEAADPEEIDRLLGDYAAKTPVSGFHAHVGGRVSARRAFASVPPPVACPSGT